MSLFQDLRNSFFAASAVLAALTLAACDLSANSVQADAGSIQNGGTHDAKDPTSPSDPPAVSAGNTDKSGSGIAVTTAGIYIAYVCTTHIQPTGGDDAPAIQKALNDGAAGSTLCFDAGNYRIAKQIIVPENRNMQGPADAVALINADFQSAPGAEFMFQISSNSHIDRLTFDAGGHNVGLRLNKDGGLATKVIFTRNVIQNLAGTALTVTSGLDECEISGNAFKGINWGMMIYNPNNTYIRENTFERLAGRAMHVYSLQHATGKFSAVVSHNRVTNSAGDIGFEFQGMMDKITISRNYLSMAPRSNNYMVMSLPMSEGTNIHICNNVMVGGGHNGPGIELSGHDILVEGNYGVNLDSPIFGCANHNSKVNNNTWVDTGGYSGDGCGPDPNAEQYEPGTGNLIKFTENIGNQFIKNTSLAPIPGDTPASTASCP